jgi:hypothetical protein
MNMSNGRNMDCSPDYVTDSISGQWMKNLYIGYVYSNLGSEEFTQ